MTTNIRSPFSKRTLHDDPIFGEIRIKNETDLTQEKKSFPGRYCGKPFEYLEINPSGDCILCCPSWLPNVIGNIYEDSILDIWYGGRANLIRETILDGSYSYCSNTLCPLIINDHLYMLELIPQPYLKKYPKMIVLGIDESCNLKCPSCRSSRVSYTSGEEYDAKKTVFDRVVNELFSVPHNEDITLMLNSSGDIFGSKITREFMFNFDPTPWPNLKLNIMTHGVLFTKKYWDKIHLWHDRIHDFHISFDAATKETYDKIRVGGNWPTLLENCRSIYKQMNQSINLSFDFVVQDLNFREIPAFIELINREFPKAQAMLQLVVDWGTWTDNTFKQRSVWKPDHPDYLEYIHMLKTIRYKVKINEYKNVVLGNLGNQ
jgi:MoaA/NifB/PqqE/SkfB family radical SAM enzyme